MKKTPDLPEGKLSALDNRDSHLFDDFFPVPDIAVHAGSTSKFLGTDNPRHFRAIDALLTRPQPREHLDRRVGCSNSPELVAELRRRGLDIPCKKIADFDRDGRAIRRGVYYLTERDRRHIRAWKASFRKKVACAPQSGILNFSGDDSVTRKALE